MAEPGKSRQGGGDDPREDPGGDLRPDSDWEDDWDEEAPPEEAEAAEEVRILVFRLGTEEYGARLEQMREVLKFHDVSFVPRTPDYLLGILSLRGRIIPVISPRVRLGIEGPSELDEPRVLVFHGSAEAPDDPVGALADSVAGVVRIAPEEILPPPNTLTEEQARLIEGVFRAGGRFVSILNLDELLRIEIPPA